jgi:hypothetical protein
MTAILVATAGLTVVAVDRLGAGGDGSDQVIAPAEGTTSTDAPTSTTAIPAGAAQVSGTVTAVHLDGAVLDPREVAAPFTLTGTAGFGNGARLTGVQVEGTPATIEWDAGRPFVISSGASLVLDPATADLTPEGVRLVLGGGVHELTPGTYHLDTPVAVGTSGVAGGRESVVFEATDTAVLEARGDAGLLLAGDGPRRLLGPGTVHLEGALEVTDAAGTRTAARLDAALGAFDLTITRAADGGWQVSGAVQGELTTA